jgi:hypothetical protein
MQVLNEEGEREKKEESSLVDVLRMMRYESIGWMREDAEMKKKKDRQRKHTAPFRTHRPIPLSPLKANSAPPPLASRFASFFSLFIRLPTGTAPSCSPLSRLASPPPLREAGEPCWYCWDWERFGEERLERREAKVLVVMAMGELWDSWSCEWSAREDSEEVEENPAA